MRPHLLRAVCVVLGTALSLAQEPAFEVASIRPTPATVTKTGDIQIMPNGRFLATGTTPKALILRAYGLVDAQVIGAPSWLDSDRFEIDARTAAPPVTGPESLLPMVQRLLVERFKLQAHTDTRELGAYALTLARRDRQRGPQLLDTRADCTKASTLTVDEVRAAARDGWPPCGMSYFVSFVTGPTSGLVKMRVRRSGTTIAALATSLQRIVDRPVIDQTGLDGLFDVEYTYAPPQTQTPSVESPFGPEAPLLQVALEEQLGLKLESRRMAVPVLVIDSVDRPTDN
jgi:uncharacterized protein (TIGR03435 family)